MASLYRFKSIVIALFFCGTSAFMANTSALAGSKCADLLRMRCQSCHSLNKTCAELGNNKEQWQRTIKAMGNYSPSITEKEQKVLVKCLAKQKKDVVELCGK